MLTFGAFVAIAATPGPSQAVILGYRCLLAEPAGGGRLEAARYVRGDGALGEKTLNWFIPDPAHRQQLRTFVYFSDVESGARVRGDQLMVAFNYNGVPNQPLWLVARMGSSMARKLLWGQATRTFVAHEEAIRLDGQDFRDAYTAGTPLEVYVQRGDGTVEDQRRLAMAERTAVAARAAVLSAGIEAIALDYRRKCQPDVLSPLPVR